METQKQEEKREKLGSKKKGSGKESQKQLEAQEKGSKTTLKATLHYLDKLRNNNCCAACLGNNKWNVDSAWFGCSNECCKKWFHKNCISMDVDSND